MINNATYLTAEQLLHIRDVLSGRAAHSPDCGCAKLVRFINEIAKQHDGQFKIKAITAGGGTYENVCKCPPGRCVCLVVPDQVERVWRATRRRMLIELMDMGFSRQGALAALETVERDPDARYMLGCGQFLRLAPIEGPFRFDIVGVYKEEVPQ